MNTMKILSIASFFLIAGCKKDTVLPIDNNSPPINNSSVVEGTVFYFEGGGTVEMPYPPGFRIMYTQWITQTADSALPVYLSGSVDSSYIDKRVRAIGTTQKITLHGSPSSYIYSILEMKCDSLRIIN
jgi:hypothetical protein